MTLRAISMRAAAALLFLAACSGEPGMTGATARTPPLTWQQVESVKVLCLVAPDTLPARNALQTEICRTVRDIAAEGAPLPVETLAFGDPALLDPTVATLLVHAAVETVSGQPTLLYTIRTYRAGRAETDILFGAPPRAVPLAESGAADPALRHALTATLAETLPWMEGR